MNPFYLPPILLEIGTDACTGKTSSNSSGGWGASYHDLTCGGAWDQKEQLNHINIRELKATYYALRSFNDHCKNKHVRILCDSTAAIGMVNKMGSSKNRLGDQISKTLWSYCQQNDICVTVTYIPGKLNVIADKSLVKNIRKLNGSQTPKSLKTTF